MPALRSPLLGNSRPFFDRAGLRILREFTRLLALRNTAESPQDLVDNAAYIAEQFERRHCRVEVWQHGDSAPAVFAETIFPGTESPEAVPTLCFYAHYDGQPAPEPEWLQSPWEPTLFTGIPGRGGKPISFPQEGEPLDPTWRICARSSADNKAPMIAWWAALDILKERSLSPGLKLKFFVEGEEETGSKNLGPLMRAHRDQLQADLFVVCDGPIHPTRKPQLFFGARGFLGQEWTVFGANRALHSGHYGNWAPNPALELATLLSQLRGEDGTLSLIPPTEPNLDERNALKSVPAQEEELRKDLQLPHDWKEHSKITESWLGCTLNIRGIQSGAAGRISVNCVPDTAWASLDVRLAPGENPETWHEKLEDHVRDQGFYLVHEPPNESIRSQHAKILMSHRDSFCYPGYRTDMSHPSVKALTQNVAKVVDQSLILLPTLGGSLPLSTIHDSLGIPIVGLPIANHDNHQHGANENLRIENLWYGVRVFESIFSGLLLDETRL